MMKPMPLNDRFVMGSCRKDLVEELAKPQWWVDRKGEIPEGKSDVYQLRVFHYHEVGPFPFLSTKHFSPSGFRV